MGAKGQEPRDEGCAAGIALGRGMVRIAADAVVYVTSRTPNDDLWQALKSRKADWADTGIQSIKVFGDAEAPAPIAWATYAGHRFARELDGPELVNDEVPFRREVVGLAAEG